MEMIIVVLAASDQCSVGAAVTSEVCPTVPGPHQSRLDEPGTRNCEVFITKRGPSLLFTLNQLSHRPFSFLLALHFFFFCFFF